MPHKFLTLIYDLLFSRYKRLSHGHLSNQLRYFENSFGWRQSIVMSSSPSEDGISYIENGEEEKENKDNFKEWNLDMETLEKDKQHQSNKPLKLLRL